MQPVPDIRRTPNGAIDYDFYRAKASVLRAEAMRRPIKLAISACVRAISAALGAADVRRA